MDYDSSHPIDTQHKTLIQILSQAQGSEWSKKYDFKSIKSSDILSSRIPVSTYEDIFPFIERMMKGQANVLWPGKVLWYAKSSGTTNAKSKFIPVTKESLQHCHYKGGKDLISMYFSLNPQSKMFDGKGLAIGGSYQTNELNKDSYYGDISAVIMANLPQWASFASTPSRHISLLNDWDRKLDLMSKICSGQKVSNMSGVPTWAMVLLQKILTYTGKKNLLELWPQFEVFFHGAVAFAPYKKIFHNFFPSSDVHYMETYNASEGFFAIKDRLDGDDMLLMLNNGIYYEFIENSFDTDYSKAIGLEHVKLKTNYAMVITTNGGLWRYLIGDTIQFTSLAPYRIKISGRTKHFLNAFGEELVVENAETAISIAAEKTNAEIYNFTAAPVYMEQGKSGTHQWAIEFKTIPNSLEDFTNILDAELKKLNSDYEAKRHNNYVLHKPQVMSIQNGVFIEWLKRKQRLGSQSKIPRLSNNREIIEEILQIDAEEIIK